MVANPSVANPSDVTAISEKQLTVYVKELAKLFGWRRYHTFWSKHSAKGYPDECLVRDGRLIYAELKSERGKVTPDQQAWLDDLQAVPGVEIYCWRPSQMDAIAEILR